MADKKKDEYFIRLLFKVEADSPVGAVEEFIDRLNSFGLKTWVYTVENVEARKTWHVKGDGSDTLPVTRDQVLAEIPDAPGPP